MPGKQWCRVSHHREKVLAGRDLYEVTRTILYARKYQISNFGAECVKLVLGTQVYRSFEDDSAKSKMMAKLKNEKKLKVFEDCFDACGSFKNAEN